MGVLIPWSLWCLPPFSAGNIFPLCGRSVFCGEVVGVYVNISVCIKLCTYPFAGSWISVLFSSSSCITTTVLMVWLFWICPEATLMSWLLCPLEMTPWVYMDALNSSPTAHYWLCVLSLYEFVTPFSEGRALAPTKCMLRYLFIFN